jgi:hypothetical protein
MASFGGYEASRGIDINRELTALIRVLQNITYGKLFLLGEAYPLAESS